MSQRRRSALRDALEALLTPPPVSPCVADFNKFCRRKCRPSAPCFHLRPCQLIAAQSAPSFVPRSGQLPWLRSCCVGVAATCASSGCELASLLARGGKGKKPARAKLGRLKRAVFQFGRLRRRAHRGRRRSARDICCRQHRSLFLGGSAPAAGAEGHRRCR